MIAYLDSSALVKLFLVEDGSDAAREIWDSGLRIATSRVSHAELACAIAAAIRNRRYSAGRVDARVVDGTFLRKRAEILEPDEGVVDAAAVLGVRHGLRGIDAIHVASALELAELEPTLVSWDERQRRAAAPRVSPSTRRRRLQP